jgi:hypothetical protein
LFWSAFVRGRLQPRYQKGGGWRGNPEGMYAPVKENSEVHFLPAMEGLKDQWIPIM